VKRFGERNDIDFDNITEDKRSSKSSLLKVHDLFILACFYKQNAVPFTFFDQSRPHFRKLGEVDGRKFDRIALVEEYVDPKYDSKESYRFASDDVWLTGNDREGYVGREHADVFVRHAGPVTLKQLVFLRDHLYSSENRDILISLFHQQAQIEDEDVVEILGNLVALKDLPNEEEIENSIALGKKKSIGLISNFRELRISSSASFGFSVPATKNFLEDEALVYGIKLWGNRRFKITGLQELSQTLTDLERYFPKDSKLKESEIEKILKSFISNLMGVKMSIEKVTIKYKYNGANERIKYEGYTLSERIQDAVATEEQADQLLKAVEITRDKLSYANRLFLGKIIYRLMRNSLDKDGYDKLSFFNDFDSQMQLIEALFPDYSEAKDDFIFQALDEHSVSKSDYLKAIKRTSRFVYKKNDDETNKGVFFLEMVKDFVRQEKSEVRKDLLLWLLTEKDQNKPEMIQRFEERNNANVDELISIVGALTPTERKSFLDDVLKGEKGLFEVDYRNNSLIETLRKDKEKKDIIENVLRAEVTGKEGLGNIKSQILSIHAKGDDFYFSDSYDGDQKEDNDWVKLRRRNPLLGDEGGEAYLNLRQNIRSLLEKSYVTVKAAFPSIIDFIIKNKSDPDKIKRSELKKDLEFYLNISGGGSSLHFLNEDDIEKYLNLPEKEVRKTVIGDLLEIIERNTPLYISSAYWKVKGFENQNH